MEKRKNILRNMKICRFCLTSEEKELSSIYQKEVKVAPLPVQIMSCVSIEVFPNDGLPQLICNACKEQTNQSYIFKSNCKKSDDTLKHFLQTGELIQPDFPKLIKTAEKPVTPISPVKDVQIVESEPTVDDSPQSKKIKLDDGTEIITLCITKSENNTQDESSHDSDRNEESEELDGERFEVISETQDETKQVETDIFPCRQCDRTFPLKQLLQLHLVNHTREREFPCTTCSSEFFTKYDLLAHEKTHLNVKPYTCVICSRVFGREALLRRHEQTHTEVPKYACLRCDRTFLIKEDLSIHMKKHDKKRPFTCKECYKSFVFKQGLERHMLSVHAQDKPHKCNYCDAAFSTQVRLTRHITTHAGLRPYPCKVCGRTFLLSHHLTRHMRSHYAADQGRQPEEAIGQHKCDICSMSFRKKDHLINHSAIHSMVNLRCVICNTSFETANMVKEHITTHLQVLPFPCEKCDYSFDSQDQLEEHELKHAEMEYEEQIEQEVISEVKQILNQQSESEGEYAENVDEVSEFHITGIDNPEVVPSNFQLVEAQKPTQSSSQPKSKGELNQFFITQSEDTEEEPRVVPAEETEGDNSIKPIFRVEGTKMYERKGPIQRKIPKVPVQAQNVQTASLDQINEKPNMEGLGITSEELSNLPAKKPVNVKIGDKMVKVQKFIISKEEMKQMAKLGILEVKNGQVIMKNPGQPVLNATIKPVQPSDIENLLSNQKQKPQIKQYERKQHARTS